MLLLSIGGVLVGLSLFLFIVGLLALLFGPLLLGIDAVLGSLCSSLDFFGSLTFLFGDFSVSLCTFLGSSNVSGGLLCSVTASITATSNGRHAAWRSTGHSTATTALRTELLTQFLDDLVHLFVTGAGGHLHVVGGRCLVRRDLCVLGSCHAHLDGISDLLNLTLLLRLSRLNNRGRLFDVNLAEILGCIKPVQNNTMEELCMCG